MFKLQKLEITGFKSFADYTELVFTGSGITAIVGPNGCGKCVSGDTLVTLADGRDIPIRELVEDALRDAPEVEVLDDGTLTRQNPHAVQILSLHPETLRLEPRPVAAFVKRQATPHLLRVRTRSGREVTATPYHPLFTLEGGRLRALKAEELKVGVRLALPRRLPVAGAEPPLEPRELLRQFRGEDNIYVPNSAPLREWAAGERHKFGTWAGWAHAAGVPATALEGFLEGQAVNAAALSGLAAVAGSPPPLQGRWKSKGSGQLTLPARFTPDMARFCGLLIAEGRNTDAGQVWFVNSDEAINDEFERLAQTLFGLEVSRKHYKSCATDSLIYSGALGATLERLFDFPVNSSSTEKQAPPQVLAADEPTQWAFLSGLFEGDAYVCARPESDDRRAHAYIEYTTASPLLARQVVALLLRLGVFATLRKSEKYAANTEAKRRRTYYSVLIYGTEQLRRVAQNLSFVGSKRRALEALRGLTQKSNPNRDLIPEVTTLVRKAAHLAGVNIKASRGAAPKLAAYAEGRCEASRGGLMEVAGQIEQFGSNPERARGLLDRLAVLATSDVYWDEIVQIEQVEPPDEWVYDLCVEGTHNFVAGNIIVHNSNVSDAISWVLGEQRVKQLRGGEMKDVIFQGSRNRQPSGMAEVVLHMVRDETVEEEPDIDDIDSALEEIDEQTESIEQKLAPEVSNVEATPDAEAAVMAPTTTANAAVPAEAAQPETVQSVTPTTTESTSTAETTEGAAEDAAQPAKRVQHKRHWRPRRMALDFAPGETVTVTRRLYRSGESEYLLNGRVCRLRDIQDLFSGTGLSGAHYAIIEQGRIGQILSAKPMDRRTLLEEAAGISKFRVRQRAAEARLESARSNLSRVSDIISEIDRQVNSLRRQAAKARRYRALREELRELLRQTYAADDRHLNAQLEDLRARIAAANEEATTLSAQLETREEEARRATAESREREDELAEARAAVSDATLRHDRRERERAYQEEQSAALERRVEDVRQEVERLRARLAAISEEGEGLRRTDVQLREESEESAQRLALAEAAHSARLAEVQQAELVIETARAELLTHTAVVERLREIGRQLEAALDKLVVQAEGLAREGERAEAALAQAQAQAEILQKEITVARSRLAAMQSEREEAARSIAEARERVAETSERHNRVRDEMARVRHRLDTLEEIDTQRSLYPQAVQRIFSQPAESDPPKDFHAIGTIADVLRVEPHWERAVESVFGPLLQSVIVPTPDDALRGAAWLEASDAGRANFIVAGLHGGSESDEESVEQLVSGASLAESVLMEGVELRMANLLGAPREIASVLRRTLPRKMNARVVSSLDQAITLSLSTEEMCVTPAGEWVVGGQLLSAGGPVVAEEGAGLLSFKREMRELGARAVGLEADVIFAEEAASEARNRLGELEDAYVLLNEAIVREEREQVARELRQAQLTQEIERAERHIRVVTEDAARLAEERRALEERRDQQTAETEKVEAARLAATESISLAADVLANARRAAEESSEELSRQRAAAAAAAERRRAAASELRRMESESTDLAARIERHEAEAEQMRARLEELRRSLASLDESAGEVEGERERLEREVEEAAARLSEARKRSDALSLEVTELHQKVSEAREARASLDVQRAETSARLSYVRESCLAELNASLEEIAREFAPAEDFDLESARARVEEMRARIEAFGAVNMMALEELGEAEERLKFLTAQRADITDGIISTEEALREIKKRSRERFRHAFEEINRNFGQFFQELFGGGRGEMSMIDAEDVLESGIDIVAQPPGKRLQNVLLLSGGEKAMAALALVLAIFRYRPSPFCLLDEVDAPLDEANIGRFTTKVQEMSADTQFLVITHNKRTMEVARALYGVTMEEAGVSKLVSVRFE